MGKPEETAPDQGYEVGLFRPGDAPGVADLFLEVYGRDYPIRKFIDPDLLLKENQTKKTISIVIRTPGGRIVGHVGFFQGAPCKRLYELGSGLVSKDYRGGKGLFTEMMKLGIKTIETLPEPGIPYGESVCNHLFTQKTALALHFRPSALEVDLMPAKTYAKEKSSAGRVSALLEFILPLESPSTVFIPNCYQIQAKIIYEGLGKETDIQISDGDWPPGINTMIKVDYFDSAQTARLEVQQAGADFGAVLADEENKLFKQGALVAQVWLNLSWPWVGKAVDELRRQGYFLGGVLPRWFDVDGFLMQKRVGAPNWEGIQLASDRGRMLFDLVKADWKERLKS
ncbi:MAG: hypothetical protein V1816_24165 [Pseudomonadota bacterium]